MKKTALFLLLAVMLSGCSSGVSEEQKDPRYQSIDTMPMLIMQIQKMLKALHVRIPYSQDCYPRRRTGSERQCAQAEHQHTYADG